VPGRLTAGAGQALPFFARIRFEGYRLLQFQAKIADTVVGPALAKADAPEPHPFGAVLRKLMDNRGVSTKELARQTVRAMSTINAARTGWHNPHPVLVREIARALGIPEGDLAAIAGVDVATFGAPENTTTPPGRSPSRPGDLVDEDVDRVGESGGIGHDEVSLPASPGSHAFRTARPSVM
jgi:hypothetical protein